MISIFLGGNIQENFFYMAERIGSTWGYQVTGKQQHTLILLDLNTVCKPGKWQEMLKQLRSVALLLYFEVFKNIVLKPTLVSMVSLSKGALIGQKFGGKNISILVLCSVKLPRSSVQVSVTFACHACPHPTQWCVLATCLNGTCDPRT